MKTLPGWHCMNGMRYPKWEEIVPGARGWNSHQKMSIECVENAINRFDTHKHCEHMESTESNELNIEIERTTTYIHTRARRQTYFQFGWFFISSDLACDSWCVCPCAVCTTYDDIFITKIVNISDEREFFFFFSIFCLPFSYSIMFSIALFGIVDCLPSSFVAARFSYSSLEHIAECRRKQCC